MISCRITCSSYRKLPYYRNNFKISEGRSTICIAPFSFNSSAERNPQVTPIETIPLLDAVCISTPESPTYNTSSGFTRPPLEYQKQLSDLVSPEYLPVDHKQNRRYFHRNNEGLKLELPNGIY